MSNRNTDRLTPCTMANGTPCPGNADRNFEVFRADVTLANDTVSFRQATNTNLAGTCPNCPLKPPNERTGSNGWPVINLDGTAIAFHSCCPTDEFPNCQFVLGGVCFNTGGNNDVFQWRDGLIPAFTQVTDAPNDTLFTNNFAISMTTVNGSSRVAFYGQSNVTGQNPDQNNEIFLWREGNPTPIQQITQTTNCGNRQPAIIVAGNLMSFTSTCPTGAGGITPCARYDGAACDNADGNEEVFFWDPIAQFPFTQVTQTRANGRTAPNN